MLIMTMSLREAAEMALLCLETSRVFVTSRERIKRPEGEDFYDEAIEVLREALAEAHPPAALPESAELSDEDAQIARAWDRFTAELENPSPLTDEEILEIWSPSPDGSVQRPILGKNKIIAFARALLAAARGSK